MTAIAVWVQDRGFNGLLWVGLSSLLVPGEYQWQVARITMFMAGASMQVLRVTTFSKACDP